MNTWHTEQLKNNKTKRFEPRWNEHTMLYIIDQLLKMIDVEEIQYALKKEYGIKIRTARSWVEMGQRVLADMNNDNISLLDALEKDRKRRNIMRKKVVYKK